MIISSSSLAEKREKEKGGSSESMIHLWKAKINMGIQKRRKKKTEQNRDTSEVAAREEATWELAEL